MADQFRHGRWPSASQGDLARLETEARGIGHEFDRSPLRFPGLVGKDGRQDFPHFWLYPLVNVPALAVVTTLGTTVGIHPNWAFTLTNVVLLAIAFAIVARFVSIPWATLILAGPLIWWIDKAHGDVFTVTLLAVACAIWRVAPAWTMVLVAGAAAQNPALMPVWAFTVVVLLWPLGGGLRRGRGGLMVGAGCSAAIVAMPLVYYQHRLGVWSPLIGYTHPAWPSMRAVMSLLADPNIGLLPNAPFVMIAGVVAIVMRARERELDRRGVLLAATAWVLLLAAFAQSVNLNHGATPGINRWTLWLTPWLMLIAGRPRPGADAGGAGAGVGVGARVLASLAVLNVLWAVWFFRPAIPENYRYPTMTASWLWTHAAQWYAPAPEIFAERASHREPASLPLAWPGCTQVLIVDGRWPVSCVPTGHVPPSCFGADRLCYATSTSTTTFTPLGTATFPWLPAAEPTWPGNAAFVAALHEALATANTFEPSDDIIRAANGVRWVTAWSSTPSTPAPTRIAIYAEELTPLTSLEVRVDANYRGHLIDLDTRRAIADVVVARSTTHPSALALPFAAHHALVQLELTP